MSQNPTIHFAISNPKRHALLAEQVGHLKHVALSDAASATLILTDEPTNVTHDNIIVLERGPLRLGEIMDRVRYALSGRTQHVESVQEILLGDFIFRPDENCLIHTPTEDVISLTDKERLLLRVLHDAPVHTMDRASLLKTVWQYAESTETHTFETHLYRLRQKLEPYGAQGLITADGEGNYTLNIQ